MDSTIFMQRKVFEYSDIVSRNQNLALFVRLLCISHKFEFCA